MKEKTTAGSLFFRAFPTDHIPKVMKDINVHFFLHSSKGKAVPLQAQRVPGS